jgi:hypothetical protein
MRSMTQGESDSGASEGWQHLWWLTKSRCGMHGMVLVMPCHMHLEAELPTSLLADRPNSQDAMAHMPAWQPYTI